MAEKNPCFREDLENMMALLPETIFRVSLEEPSYVESRKLVLEEHPDATEEDIREWHATRLVVFNQEQPTLRRLFQYGITTVEIVKNLRGHVLDCIPCRGAYLAYLDKLAEMHLSWAKTRAPNDPRTKVLGENAFKEGYRDYIKRTDSGLLDLLSQLNKDSAQ